MDRLYKENRIGEIGKADKIKKINSQNDNLYML